jgi:uncharacterized protein
MKIQASAIMNNLRQFSDWALVTGATSGIGLEYARALAQQGFHLLLVARDVGNLEATRSTISADARVQVQVLQADLSDARAVQRVVEAAKALDVGVVISNAGAGGLGSFLQTEIATHHAMFQLNASSHLEIAHRFANHFLTRNKRGAILLATSTAGLHGMPYGASYAAAKGAIINLAESLHAELKGTGVYITAVSPGMTDTPATRNDAVMDFGKLPFKAMQASDVAVEGLYALAQNKPHHIVGRLNRFLSNIVEQRIVGRALAVKLMDRVVLKALRKVPPSSVLSEAAKLAPNAA